MKVIITGASGMIGMSALLECISDKDIDEVLLIGRSSCGLKHDKVKEILHKDFSDYSSIKDDLVGYDACFLCMGVSAAGMSEQDYSRITYDFTLALANELIGTNPSMTITYLSGAGTDSSEKGRVMWARVKGKTENDLMNLGFKGAYMFRPGAIIPEKGIHSSTKLYQFFYDYFMWFIRFMKLLMPNSIVNTTQLGRALIAVAKQGYSKSIIDPKDIIELGN